MGSKNRIIPQSDCLKMCEIAKCMGNGISGDQPAATRALGPARRPVRRSHLSLSLRPIALSLRPSAARSSSSCKVKVTSDVLCYNRWGPLQQVQCLVESGRDTRFATIAARASTTRTVRSLWYTNSEKFMNLGVEFVWTVSRDADVCLRIPTSPKVRKQKQRSLPVRRLWFLYFPGVANSQTLRGNFSCESEDQVEGTRVHLVQ